MREAYLASLEPSCFYSSLSANTANLLEGLEAFGNCGLTNGVPKKKTPFTRHSSPLKNVLLQSWKRSSLCDSSDKAWIKALNQEMVR